MQRRVRPLLVAATILLAFLGLAVPQGPAASAAGPTTTTTLTAPKDIPPGSRVVVLQRSLTLAAGESRHLRARIDTTSSTDLVVALTLFITCRTSTGALVGHSRATARNHEGYDAPYAITGRLPLYADSLLTAPTAGTYTCALEAWTASSATSTYHLTAVADDTWLQVSDTDQVGAQQLTNPACDSKGTLPTCTYLGAGTDTMWLFYSDGSPSQTWAASSTAASVDVAASYTVTTCPIGTASCQQSAIAPYQQPRGSVNTVVTATLEVIQLDATRHTCSTTRTATTATISDAAHHFAFSQTLSAVPIRSDCGSRDFVVRVRIDRVSGQPLKIDGVQGTTALATAVVKNR